MWYDNYYDLCANEEFGSRQSPPAPQLLPLLVPTFTDTMQQGSESIAVPPPVVTSGPVSVNQLIP